MAGPSPIKPQQLSASQQQQLGVIQNMPALPDEVKQRFPSMQKWEDDMKVWVKNLNFGLQNNF